MKIGIDARFYGSIGKGLGRYTQKLIENLENIDRENQYVVFVGKENFEEYVPKAENFSKVMADCRWYTFKEQLWMPFFLNKHKLDLVHFPHFNVPIFYRRPFIVTIHDLILLHFPTTRGTTLNPLFYKLKFFAYKFGIRSAIARAKKIIAVSGFTKQDILENYPVPEDKITVTYEGVDDRCRIGQKKTEEILENYGIIKPYLLYVGNAYPHKNLERLVFAFSRLSQEFPDLKLVLVGKEDYFYRRLKELVRAKKIAGVIFPGFIPDQELDTVYREAGCYVFASLYEGFGLPPLEAMAKGAPVVSSDHACMKEILGVSAWFVDARSEEKIAEGISTVLKNKNIQADLAAKGYQQIRKYDWRLMAEKTLEIYKHIN